MKAGEKPPTYKLGGSMAEYCVTDVKQCIPLSEEMTFEEALDEVRQNFNGYIKDQVLTKAKVGHLGNNLESISKVE